MSDLPAVERASFWREGLIAFKGVVRAEGRWIVGFAVVVSTIQFWVLGLFNLTEMQSHFKSDPKELAQNVQFVKELWGYLGTTIPLQIAFAIFAFYVFTVLYLRREATSSPPQFGVSGFVYWFGKVFQKYIIFMGLGVLLGVVFAGVAATGIPEADQKMITVPLLLGWIFAYYFLTFRLSLVTPLAVLHREPVLKASWETTNGQCLRILWGILVLTLVLSPVFLLPYAVHSVVAHSLGYEALASRALDAVNQGIWEAVMTVAAAIYYCTVYRILLQEQRNHPITTKL